VVIGLKPTPARWELAEQMHQANKLLKAHCDKLKVCTYINVWPSMLGAGGKPRMELFVADGQHMSPDGYRIWTRLVKPYLR
jgi:lysophospholipase L1-like esterase